jgi:hypothetical protein
VPELPFWQWHNRILTEFCGHNVLTRAGRPLRRLAVAALPLQWLWTPQSGGTMSVPQSWVEVSAPVADGEAWLEGLTVRFRDEPTVRRLVHLDQRSFSILGRIDPAVGDLYATFVISKALSITVQVRAHEIEPGATSQVFSFVNTDIDVLDLIFCTASPTTVH